MLNNRRFRTMLLFLLAIAAACTSAAPQGNQVFSYETMGVYGEVTGHHFLNGDPGQNVDGGFGFTDKEGKAFDLTFVADENG